jgi:lysophospholipase L1-like esterase
MTWHAKSLQSSYVSPPGAGSRGHDESEAPFPFATTSWYFLDALDVEAVEGAGCIVAFGDSITDGTASTLNGDDRWPDILARRLEAHAPGRLAVVNAGIGGNQVMGPGDWSPDNPFRGGPPALRRLERDVLSLSGVKFVFWIEGINDFGSNGNASADAVIDGLREGVARIRSALPGVKVFGGTVASALGSSSTAHGFAKQDAKRRKLNEYIRAGGLFDQVLDVDRATLDPRSGGLRAEFVPDNTLGGPGDGLHPNRLGYLAIAQAIDLAWFGLAGCKDRY